MTPLAFPATYMVVIKQAVSVANLDMLKFPDFMQQSIKFGPQKIFTLHMEELGNEQHNFLLNFGAYILIVPYAVFELLRCLLAFVVVQLATKYCGYAPNKPQTSAVLKVASSADRMYKHLSRNLFWSFFMRAGIELYIDGVLLSLISYYRLVPTDWQLGDMLGAYCALGATVCLVALLIVSFY